MKIGVAGSVGLDHLMTFSGKFTDSLVAGSLEKVSLSFLVDGLEVRRGGCAANIAYGMGVLGLTPILIAAVGIDWPDYDAWLVRHGVDTSHVHISKTLHTAHFMVTTDTELNQIASFFPGAMSEARNIELTPIMEKTGKLDLIVISPDDPAAMLRHTEVARQTGVAIAADPSQQAHILLMNAIWHALAIGMPLGPAPRDDVFTDLRLDLCGALLVEIDHRRDVAGDIRFEEGVKGLGCHGCLVRGKCGGGSRCRE